MLARVSVDFGIDLARAVPVDGGLDKRAHLYFGEDADGGAWSVKLSRRDCRFGLAFARSLADEGVQGVSAPARSLAGTPWSERDGVLLSVAPWVMGADATETGAEPAQWEALGATLRAVHTHRPPPGHAPARRGIRRSRTPASRLLVDVDHVVEHSPTTSAAAEQRADLEPVQALWAHHRHRLDRLARTARRLKEERTPAPRVPLHGDPHLGNVVLDEGGRPWLIDFDEATIAPREVDLMLVELGVLFSMPIDDEQRRAFRSGYGDVPLDEQRIARFGCMRAIEDVSATMHRLLSGSSAEAETHLAILDGILGPHGLVTLTEQYLEGIGASR
ncbi:aminoglycoside phosphotransferase family protein [Naasia sp. SYSU D00057]|uniref:aminoglycoside phosphotransferase family protein n=1 Tax=Naasia sp. SYSU D00057 TaxID=2817380 RepID=UPI001B3164C6|nr:aminoglycoside phosphotransferase family protein [Naasia sp. SYSU D00057]